MGNEIKETSLQITGMTCAACANRIEKGLNKMEGVEVIEGNTAVDESMLTGESIPVDKIIGDSLFGSTINKNGFIQMKATKIGGDTALSQIIKVVEDAQGSKARIQRIADKISGIFVPVVILINVCIKITLMHILLLKLCTRST